MIHICATCGTSYESGAAQPIHCAICTDERQYVPRSGQKWTYREQIAAQHNNRWREHRPGLLSIETTPRFAIGQRAFLLTTPAGNILWDCIANLDSATIRLVTALGGLHAIAVSHPHYYTTMQDWSAAFGAPVFLHAADREWVMRPSPHLRFWEGETLELADGVRLVRLGGHFPGGTVLQLNRADKTLLVGDILQITPGGDAVSFMWSYPNMLPLSAVTVDGIADRVERLDFDRMYGAFTYQNIEAGAKAIVLRSAERYISHLN
ncbi:MBL fold metallo-hydrolase [Sphingomonas carotinifaciens]|uniref:MBL fold metallo-hydrolase n=1 Tax=Sphingomonas carotinifaciens TaxID=1166323 RepID=A0A1G7PSC1_9SPHN|nr:MBL fold metallo-hydrolase [Sphingomonas carotinifaciens]MBB4087485.1 hypothetical protein [Sphingomonas carotinifaciens]MWC45573.1 MBL fold metallo-hydrolase [Sphingomonas carotinifaciens]SDF89207.1 hypothetical protein SAMN05216557_10760 [Sphingomonas carotinifaciens]